jgi:hypothetical protein
MCPACVTTLALIATGTGSAAGLAAVAVRRIRTRPGAKSLVRREPAETPAQKEEPR